MIIPGTPTNQFGLNAIETSMPIIRKLMAMSNSFFPMTPKLEEDFACSSSKLLIVNINVIKRVLLLKYINLPSISTLGGLLFLVLFLD